MTRLELQQLINDTVQEIRDLKKRIDVIRKMKVEVGTVEYKIWTDEKAFLQKEWIKAIDKYLNATRELNRGDNHNP
jgi:hypothetical protein